MKQFPYIILNEKLVQQGEASISGSDEGLLNGMGFFTTLKVKQGIPLFFEKHLQRLEDTLNKLQFSATTIPYDVKAAVEQIIAKNKFDIAGVRITITNGNGKLPTMIIQAREIPQTIQKISVITISDKRDIYKTYKTTNRIHNVQGMQLAQKQNAQDALFTLDNQIIESTYANIYSLDNGTMITPPIAGKGLNGISRQILMQQLPIVEKEILEETTNPLVLVSSLSVRTVEKLNGKTIDYSQAFVDKIVQAIENAENEYLETRI